MGVNAAGVDIEVLVGAQLLGLGMDRLFRLGRMAVHDTPATKPGVVDVEVPFADIDHFLEIGKGPFGAKSEPRVDEQVIWNFQVVGEALNEFEVAGRDLAG